MPALNIRAMQLPDLEAVLAVEQSSFLTPWSREAFVAEIEDNDLACYLVAEAEGQVVGYAGMWIILDEAHVTNVALLPAFRGRGLGTRLMDTLRQVAKALGAARMTLEVRPSNHEARRLYGKLGFAERGVRPGYYTDTKEDAIIMWLDGL
ncbi:ribosomal protein S18-alanine N-acetyltransferase [Anaeroselena agilis]|uniref:[Ribosomal protein bS18]-alanine N-acetyltransferase n=1 Tax=Anaeroselena agilis TaxID=3063788 RepID=A0ABU3NT81_9FIRM|nr:ribosomal protein S18-alanine N-acetyltransferase [Selenomonadales bacterium 4137-cl]